MSTTTFEVYNVTTGKDGKTYWKKIGLAFPFEKDGRTGFNIPNMNFVVIQPKEEEGEAQEVEPSDIPATV
jgi:hypothetical protein